MPLYEYHCRNCGRPFERLLGMSQADQSQACPTCGSQETQRQVSAFAVAGSSQSREVSTRPARSPFT